MYPPVTVQKFGQSPLWRAASIKSTREDRRVPDNTDDITSTIECLIQKGGNVNQSDVSISSILNLQNFINKKIK